MFIRIVSSFLFLFLVVLFVPLAFDVGGRDAGLAYSLALVTFYLLLSILRVSTPDRSRIRWTIVQILRGTQWIIVPALLIWALGRFSIDTDNSRGSWVERTFRVTKDVGTETNTTTWSRIFGSGGLFDFALLRIWDKSLQISSPFFQLCEGFCSLLVIQATGQFTRWLVNHSDHSDAWMLTIIVAAAGISSSSVYFLWRVLQFPDISTLDATLIGITIAAAIFLCAYGVASGRGTAAESSLLFAYIVLCLYQIFTDYKPNAPSAEAAATRVEPDFPPFPPIIMSSYHSSLQALTMMPDFAVNSLNFVSAAFAAVTPSVIISLGYRLFVFYASTRIIPAINESGARGLSLEPTLEDSDAGNKLLAFLSWFSPSILISVYTSLLMQHFATTIGGYSPGITGTIGAWWSGNGQPGMDGNLWKWVNLVGTMALYVVELTITKDEDIEGTHWKVD